VEVLAGLLSLNLSEHGAQWLPGALLNDLADLRAMFLHLPQSHAGTRIQGLEALRPYRAPTGPVGALAAGRLGPDCFAVRAILFDKTAETNWSLAWHQDRTICVRQGLEIEGFGPWTIKGGMHHVAPPFDLLARMVTLRVHLDDVPGTNAPLMIAPGSHRLGMVAADEAASVAKTCGRAICLARAGDAWLYATPVLHASEAAAVPGRRRVLQVDFAAEALPTGLEWLGV